MLCVIMLTAIILIVIMLAKCHNAVIKLAECHYAGCHYAEGRGTTNNLKEFIIPKIKNVIQQKNCEENCQLNLKGKDGVPLQRIIFNYLCYIGF